MTSRSKSAGGTGPSTPRTPPMTIVIKLGTSSIVEPSPPFLPRLPLLSSIVETVVTLKKQGHRVVLVSSGAIGVGLRTMRLKERGKGLSQKQALAAIGQGRLIALWDNLFAHLDQPIAQILLTRMDIGDRTRYINAQNTFKELLEMGVVPIVNENDTVSVSEIKFGDNDTLSAIAGNVVHADYLFLLTDVDALYTDNPRSNPDAKAVRVVRDIAEVRKQVSTATFGTSLGTGGMSTKIIAAELATAAGVTTVVMNATKVSDIFGIIEGGPGPSREAGDVAHLEKGPLCTRFLRHQTALKDRKWWIAHGLHAAGTVVIDEGAYRAIGRRESGGRLLPAGVVRVEGPFASHQAVRIVVRRRKRFPPAPLLTNPISESPTPARLEDSAPNSADPDLLSPVPSGLRKTHPLAASTSAVDRSPESAASQPDTPSIQPALSLSSSVASLDPLSRTGPSSPAMKAISERLAHVSFGTIGAAAADETAQAPAPVDEWEEIEVGKGLAQYNSVEIDRIKGMKSSHIEQVLGYSESEHAVDSIALL
ncbi:Glutamate 5-kinase [Vanrija pseudolonga]|uniref:Glutamate 5-kinase n=1 Tax=Vanrija pseudolonga TaxID=143232 RepID=A0AAF0Y5G3_9TREE|nr:Glutamate 5-kinase [Vanrija pseudolonga]